MDFECVTADELVHMHWVVDGPLMVMPCTDIELAKQSGSLACRRAAAKGLLLAIEDTQRQGFVACINQAFAVSQSEWFGYMAQDAFAGRDWLALALQALHKQRGRLLGFNDGKWHGALAAFGMASRAWAMTNYPDNTFFHAGYLRHYADTELTLLARQSKAYVYEPDSVLIEVDWSKDQASVDAADRALFKQRQATGFDSKVQEQALLAMFG